MSDVLLTNDQVDGDELKRLTASILPEEDIRVEVFSGDWGTLAASATPYYGLDPVETEDHLLVVIGGPLLTFSANTHLSDPRSGSEASRKILDRIAGGAFVPDEDLDGPFALFLVEKQGGTVRIWTDMMGFIPVYEASGKDRTVYGTHVDAVAEAANTNKFRDPVSEADFLLHGLVTFPYTMYQDTVQLKPAAETVIRSKRVTTESYWLPYEGTTDFAGSMADLATELREGLQAYTDRITAHTCNIGQFLSGGEDSRALSALLQSCEGRDALLFLEEMNREGHIAKQASEAYGATFKLITRDKRMYVDMVPAVTRMTGSGAQYFHVHTYGLHKTWSFNQYDALFGGLLADALLKGSHIRKLKGSNLVPFIPQVKRSSFSFAAPISHPLLHDETKQALQKRKTAHLAYIRTFRTASAEEWFELWPANMNVNIPNVHGNRRLFRSYEPFMCHAAVKISARAPQSWKLNRRLFQQAVKPLLEPTKWLFHGEGKLPYYPWYVNMFVHGGVWGYRTVKEKLTKSGKYEGPWFDWQAILNSAETKALLRANAAGNIRIAAIMKDVDDDPEQFFYSGKLNFVQQLNYLQLLHEANRASGEPY